MARKRPKRRRDPSDGERGRRQTRQASRRRDILGTTTQRQKQRWSGFDLQKLLGKMGIEFHWPGYPYMRPGSRHASRETVETRGARRQSLGQDRQATRHRSQPSQKSAGQVESQREDGQGYRAPPRAPYHDGTHSQENHAGQANTEVITL